MGRVAGVDDERLAQLRTAVGAEVARRADPAYRGGADVVLGPCPRCGKTVRWCGRGRKPRWCSPTCRQRVKEARRVARDGEAPLAVIEGPAGPHNAEEWVRRLIDPAHWQLLAAVLQGLAGQVDAGWRAGLPPDAQRVAAQILGVSPAAIAGLREPPPPSPAPPGPDRPAPAVAVGIGEVERFIDALSAQITTGGPGVRDSDYSRVVLAAQRMVDAHQEHHRRRGQSTVPAAPVPPLGPNRAQRRAAAKHRR